MIKNNSEQHAAQKADQEPGLREDTVFKFAHTTIDTSALKATMENPLAGALVCFEGVVRNHNEGHEVVTLEYEAYETLAGAEAQKILEEARQQFALIAAICVHRTGLLSIGEPAVFVGVTSAHRDAAFQGCRYIIDEIKTRLPIWKKETYRDGSSGWVNCNHAHASNHKATPQQATPQQATPESVIQE
ncbi:MAG: molybdenum cofactor biosynthesis protein MoaE [Candidatus Obscuribacterales bacterium]|jgi:molybdopterin synthase catalytic subunit